MADDEYDKVARGKLKLKINVDMKKKKKKKCKDKDKEKAEKTIQNVKEAQETSSESKKFQGRPLTQAEKKFKEQQEKMVSIYIHIYYKNRINFLGIIILAKEKN